MIYYTLINGTILIGMIFILILMYNMLNSFGELIVRFVEQNQDHFKSQKHLVAKSLDLAQSLKKVPNIISNMKTIARKFETISTKIDQESSRISSRLGK